MFKLSLVLYFGQFKRLLAVTDVLIFETMIDLKLLDKL